MIPEIIFPETALFREKKGSNDDRRSTFHHRADIHNAPAQKSLERRALRGARRRHNEISIRLSTVNHRCQRRISLRR